MNYRLTTDRRSTSVLAAVFVAIALLTAACGSDTPDVAAPIGGQHDNGDAEHANFSFGEPADAADADRVIDIDAHDDFSFDPTAIEVKVGETVTFRVTNAGKLPHDFTLGDADTQDDHDAEMASMSMDHMGADEDNAVTLDVGATKDLTWTFTESGEILMGCHIPGHYAAGMRGTITIVGSD